MFFDGSFFFKEFCKQFNIHLLIRSQRSKTTGICNIDPIDDNEPKILNFPSGLTNGEGSLPRAIMDRIGQCPLWSKPDLC